MNKITYYQKEYQNIEKELKEWVDKYNNTKSVKKMKEYYKEIMKLEEKLEELRNAYGYKHM